MIILYEVRTIQSVNRPSEYDTHIQRHPSTPSSTCFLAATARLDTPCNVTQRRSPRAATAPHASALPVISAHGTPRYAPARGLLPHVPLPTWYLREGT